MKKNNTCLRSPFSILKTILLQLLLLLFFSNTSYAFERHKGDEKSPPSVSKAKNELKNALVFTITGQITDVTGAPLIGASVVLEGTAKGAITDDNGKFTLPLDDADKNGKLVVSFVGYESQTIPINGRTDITIQLSEGKALSEVVVIGYGTRKKADLTGSVSAIDVAQMLTKPAADVSNMLQGRIAGVVSSGSNQPGGNGYVRIRGINSFGSNEPLVIIDGVQTSGTNSINPNDIETMNVLKDASSAAIYGARGAGGVIIITTKKGKANKTRISYDGFYGVSKVVRYPKMVNTAQLGDLLWKQQLGAGIVPSSAQYGKGTTPVIPDYVLAGSSGGLFEGNAAVDPAKYNFDQNGFYQIARANKEGTDWFQEMTQAAPTQSHNLSASGGNDRSIFSMSLGYYNENGLQKYTYYDRYSARVNSEFKLGKNIRFGETMFGSFRKRRGSADNDEGSPWSQAYRMPAIVPVYDINGNFAGSKAPGTGNGQNPVAILFRARNNKDRDVRFLGSVYGELDIVEGLRFRSNFGMDYNNNYNTTFREVNPEHSEGNFQTSFALQSGFQARWTFTNTLNYDKSFGKHNINLLAGAEAVEFRREQILGDRSGYYPFTDQSFWVLDRGNAIGQNNSSTISEEALFSTFGRIDYSFDGKYLLNATVRRDGSSKFAADFRYGNFPSVSAGWRISQEPFMKNVSFITDLKLRAGYGVVGNDQIDGNNQFSFYRSDPSRSFYDIGGTNTSTVPGYDLDRKGNPNSKWEETSTLNFGVDLSMFKGAFEMNLDIYNKKTSDLLVQILRPGTEGDFTAPFINVGNTENKGVDLMLTYRGKVNQFTYAATANFTAYRNKVSSTGVDFSPIAPVTLPFHAL
jgi:TonB-dependent starch-binding outer membrane protein SusC